MSTLMAIVWCILFHTLVLGLLTIYVILDISLPHITEQDVCLVYTIYQLQIGISLMYHVCKPALYFSSCSSSC